MVYGNENSANGEMETAGVTTAEAEAHGERGKRTGLETGVLILGVC